MIKVWFVIILKNNMDIFMNTMQCKCSNIIHITENSIQEFKMMSDNIIDSFGLNMQNEVFNKNDFYKIFMKLGETVIICSTCNRMYIKNKYTNELMCYAIENNNKI